MPKRTSRDEATSNSEKIKPVALAVIKLCLSEGISQLLSQSVEKQIFKFRSKLLKAFRVNLKAWFYHIEISQWDYEPNKIY